MRKITFEVHLSIGYSGAYHEDVLEIEVDDEASYEEVELSKDEVTKDWAWNYIELNFGDNITDEQID